MASERLRIAVFMAHSGHARNFEWTLRELVERGHAVSVILEAGRPITEPLRTISAELDGVRVLHAPARRRVGLALFAVALRRWLDYLRYLNPPLRGQVKLLQRARAAAPGANVAARLGLTRTARRREGLTRALRAVEAMIPVRKSVVQLVDALDADAVVITPLVELGSPQTEYVRAAGRIGVPTCTPIAGWDNLTVRGAIIDPPDLVAVWNERQRREAIDLHAVPESRVRIVGAVAYDHWFEWQPATSRRSFCERAGIDPRDPYVLYAGSSPFTAPDERAFVVEWLRALRGAPGLEDIHVVVRPHPLNPIDRAVLSALRRVTVIPAEPSNPTDRVSRSEYFDSIFHSAAVAGINTSAFVEAVIVGRPALPILADRYADTQQRAIHFQNLIAAGNGAIHADPMARHVARIREIIAERGHTSPSDREAFLTTFVRPLGARQSATRALVEAIEALAVEGAAARKRAAERRLAR